MVKTIINHKVKAPKGAGIVMSDALVSGTNEGRVLSLPYPNTPAPLPVLRDRILATVPGATILPSESVTLMTVDLPVRGGRQRLQAAPYALEDRLSVPLDRLHLALHPGYRGQIALAAVVARDQMPGEGSGVVLVETLAVSVPDSVSGAPAWAVWRAGDRAVVRVSDGSGFGCAAEMLESLWVLAGRPVVTRLADPLPPAMNATDLSVAPPTPTLSDLGFDLRQGDFAVGGRHWAATLRTVAVIAGLGLALHLALAVADRMALERIAAAEVSATEVRLSDRLPGARMSLGLPALLDRLTPRTDGPLGSAFLPLLSDAAQALLTDAPPADVQRLTWDARSGALTLDVTARSLEDLQSIEQSLTRMALVVETGVATAADGVARADIRIGGTP